MKKYNNYNIETLISILENTIALQNNLDKNIYYNRIKYLQKLIFKKALLENVKVSPILLNVCPQPDSCSEIDKCTNLTCLKKLIKK